MSSSVRYENPPSGRKLTSLYSHVSRVQPGETVYLAGQVAARGGKFDDQFHEVFTAIGALLHDLGADFDSIAKLTTYVTNAEHVAEFRALRDQAFPKLFRGPLYPPNTLLVVQRLGNPEWLLEVEAIARLPD